MTMQSRSILAVLALAASVSLANAQTAQDHAAHHQASPDVGRTQSPPPSGSVTQEQQKPGGMAMPPGGRGMMSGREMMQMRAMMESMRDRMMADGTGPVGMGPLRHVEGRIAFYKAELAINDAQVAEWSVFADVLRGVAARRGTAAPSGGPLTAPEQLERRAAALSARLDALTSVLAAVRPLYAVLSNDQKKIADELVAEHTMGMQAHAARMP
jgi:hypothetical protein